jgi:hypothetical protein
MSYVINTVNPYQTIIDTIKKSIMPTQEEQAHNFYNNLFANMANAPLNQRTSLGQAVGAAAATNAAQEAALRQEASKYGALGAIKELGNQKFGSPAEQGVYNSSYNIYKLTHPDASDSEAQLYAYRAVVADRAKNPTLNPEQKQTRDLAIQEVKTSPNWIGASDMQKDSYVNFGMDLRNNPNNFKKYLVNPNSNTYKYSDIDRSRPYISAGDLKTNLEKDANGMYTFKTKDPNKPNPASKQYSLNSLYYNPSDGKLYKYNGKGFEPTR